MFQMLQVSRFISLHHEAFKIQAQAVSGFRISAQRFDVKNKCQSKVFNHDRVFSSFCSAVLSDFEVLYLIPWKCRAPSLCISPCVQDRKQSMFYEMAEESYKQFVEKELSNVADKKAAELLGNVIMNVYDEDFQDFDASHQSFESYLNAQGADEAAGGAADDDISLRGAYCAFKQALQETPVSTEKVTTSTEFEPVPGDADQEAKHTLHQHVIGLRKKLVHIYHTPPWNRDTFKSTGPMNRLWQHSKIITAKGEPGKKNGLVMLSGDLCPGATPVTVPSFHSPLIMTDVMKDAVKWMLGVRGASTVVLVLDGRSRSIRKETEKLMDDHVADDNKLHEGTIIYVRPPGKDPRFQRRKVFAGFENESMRAVLPVHKIHMKSKPRTHYKACGESSTHHQSYTGVPVRQFQSLPRMSLPDKEGILGVKLPVYKEEVVAACGARGHPLFAQEVKDVNLFVALFEDYNVDHVWDLTIGSCSAACAAAALGIQYEGVAMNEQHANWCERIMDKAMFAVVADSDDDETKQLREDLRSFFGPLIEEARQYLASGEVDDVDDETEDGDEGDDQGKK